MHSITQMENDDVTIDETQASARETAETEMAVSTLDDSLRSLRLRRYETPGLRAPSDAEADKENSSGNEAGEEAEADLREEETGSSDEESVAEEARLFFSEAFDDLTQEVRRVGREMFRSNRVAERNQEAFDEAISEIRQLSSEVALIPAQHNEAINSARFEAKAGMCRELLRMLDTLEASLSAADDLISQFQAKADQSQQGLVFHFSSSRQLYESLIETVAAMRQWRMGQKLLAERLQAILQTAGVREIEVMGRPFDPQLHRAVSVAECHDLAPGTVVGEELKGYTLEGRILRYSEVIVAKNE